jgi:hypothetical protein
MFACVRSSQTNPINPTPATLSLSPDTFLGTRIKKSPSVAMMRKHLLIELKFSFLPVAKADSHQPSNPWLKPGAIMGLCYSPLEPSFSTFRAQIVKIIKSPEGAPM